MTTPYLTLTGRALRAHWLRFLGVGVGFFVMYYVALLLLTMLRFGEIPNYVEFYDIFAIYGLIWEGTPSVSDMIPIMLDEAWVETGYKNPDYYGVATWSYMLIPPKMLLVLSMGVLLGLFVVFNVYRRETGACAVPIPLLGDRGLVAATGVSSSFIALTSATLTWVVCCATPSWSVALAMLGMSATLALWLEPIGNVLTVAGFVLMLAVIFVQLRSLDHAVREAAAQA